MTISRQEGALNVLKSVCNVSTEKMSYQFLSDACNRHFTFATLHGGPRSYLQYIVDHIMPGKVVVTKKNVRYVAEDGSIVDESAHAFVTKVLESTSAKATELYMKHKEGCIEELCTETDGTSPTELARKFANMALVRSCNPEFCSDVATLLVSKKY